MTTTGREGGTGIGPVAGERGRDLAFHGVQNTKKAHDDITLLDVAYTNANPPGLDINRLATQEELLRLWWPKTPSTQPRWIVGEEIPRAANVQYDGISPGVILGYSGSGAATVSGLGPRPTSGLE